MAFYRDFNKQSKEEKQRSAEMRGGFDDEGTRYRGAAGSGGRPPRARDGNRTGEDRMNRVNGQGNQGQRVYENRTGGAGRTGNFRNTGGQPYGERGYAPGSGASAQGSRGKQSGGGQYNQERGYARDSGAAAQGSRGKQSGGGQPYQERGYARDSGAAAQGSRGKQSGGGQYYQERGYARDSGASAQDPRGKQSGGGQYNQERGYARDSGASAQGSRGKQSGGGQPYQERGYARDSGAGAQASRGKQSGGGQSNNERGYARDGGASAQGSRGKQSTGGQPYQERGYARDSGVGAPPRPYAGQRDARQEREPAAQPQRQIRPTEAYRYDKPQYQERGAAVPPRPYAGQREARQGRAPVTQPPRQNRPSEAFLYDKPPAYDMPTPLTTTDTVPLENLLSGRNPIREALKSGRDIEKLLVARGELSGSAKEIVQMAKERHIPVQEVDRTRLDAITRNHQGMLAFASAYQYQSLEDMLALAKERGEAPFLVILDGITDPHNLGAIIRTAECAGAHGVIVQERRAVGLTPAAVKASAGAVEYLPVARVTNLTQTILELKEQNIWVFAADMDGEEYTAVDFSGSLALVIGAEGEGISHRVLESCDRRVALPIRGKLASLNASVAAGVLLYAALRAR